MSHLETQSESAEEETDWTEDGSTDEEITVHLNNTTSSGDNDDDGNLTYVQRPRPFRAPASTATASLVSYEIPNLREHMNEDPLWWMKDILHEFSETETARKLQAFAEFTKSWICTKGFTNAFTFAGVLQASRLYDIQRLKKEKEDFGILVALWVVFLRAMKTLLYDEIHLKYNDVDDFLHAYEGQFDGLDPKELNRLMDTANWMAILLPMVVAKKSKGLALQVIPKMLEGFCVKYVTGSGQSKSTSNRVRIFEMEGNVQPCKKRKWGLHKLGDRDDDSEEPLRSPAKKKDRKSPTGRGKPRKAIAEIAPPVTSVIIPSFVIKPVMLKVEDVFTNQDISKFRRESFYNGPPVLRRDWSEDFGPHFDIDIDQLL